MFFASLTTSADAIFQIKSLFLSFRTVKGLRKLIELLPSGPRWKRRSIKPESPAKSDLQLFYRDAIECLQHLIHSPAINGQIEFVPKKIYSAADHMERIYTEWLTGDRAWELQVCTVAGSSAIAHFTSRMHYLTAQLFSVQFFPLIKRTSPKSGIAKHTRF